MTSSARPTALHARLARPEDLRPEERAAWRAMLDGSPAFQSPLLAPEFADTVARVRDDATVAVFTRDDGEIAGLLAHHRRPGGVARPIGAPWSDAHALLTWPGRPLPWRDALRAAGLRAYRFSHLVDPHGVFADVERETGPAYLLASDPAGGEAAWERLRAGSAKRFKNLRRLEHKLEREVGPLAFGADDDAQALASLLGWQRDQLLGSGAEDVLAPAWSRALMHEVSVLRGAEASGLHLTLRAGGRLVAGQFGLREGAVFHPWIAAYDPALAAYSPGLVFMSMAVRLAPALGIARYELSTGSDDYKAVFADAATEPSGAGVAALAARTPALASAPLVRRIASRLDHIAETDITWTGRACGFARAVAGAGRLAASPVAKD